MLRRGSAPEAAEWIPGGLLVAAMVLAAADEGGFEPTTWLPLALFTLGLAAVTLLSLGPPSPKLARAPRVALLALACYVAWSYLSITWADVPGDAWDGANRSLLYLLAFGLVAILPWRARSASLVVAAYVAGISAIALVTLVDLSSASNPAESFIDGRLVAPTGYQNATAALLLGAGLLALGLAARPDLHWALRGTMLGAAALDAGVAILPQSRGASIVLPVVLVVFLLLTPNRLRVLGATALAGLATTLAAGPVIDVYDLARTGSGAELAEGIDRASRAILISSAALAAVGLGLAFLERRLGTGRLRNPPADRGALAAVGALVIAGAVAALLAIGNPLDWADDRWRDFKSGYSEDQFGDSRLAGDLGNNRYDFWRVGISSSFGDSPLTGAGADNWAVDYLRERRSGEEPAYPHSLPVRALAGTGIVGGGLLLAFLVAAATAAITAARRAPPEGAERALIATLGAAGLYWLLHAGGDWLWSFPAVTMPALVWLGIAGRLDGREAPPTGRPWPRLLIGCGIVLSLVAAASLLLPFGAARDTERATQTWRSDPRGALDRLDRAASLNPLSARPDLLAGTIATRIGDTDLARERFAAALERAPDNWYAELEVGAIDALEGRRKQGLEHLSRARALNPMDPLVGEALRAARNREPLSLQRIERELLSRLCSRVGRTSDTDFCR